MRINLYIVALLLSMMYLFSNEADINTDLVQQNDIEFNYNNLSDLSANIETNEKVPEIRLLFQVLIYSICEKSDHQISANLKKYSDYNKDSEPASNLNSRVNISHIYLTSLLS